MFVKIEKRAEHILNVLENYGFKAYVVGGCVRDAMLGIEPHDWDICSNATPAQVEAAFNGYPVIESGIDFGTITVMIDGEGFEVTTFRKDGDYADGRKPDGVAFVGNVIDDLARRDFTINAMAYNHVDGLVDPFGGADDLTFEVIRCVGDPAVRFAEDKLRVLRAIRFSAKLGFAIEPETKATMMAVDSLAGVSNERLGQELAKLIVAPYAAKAISENKDVFLRHLIPEMAPCAGCAQNSKYHAFDVFDHTMCALENANRNVFVPADGTAEYPAVFSSINADEIVMLALLLHDIGKPATKTTDSEGHDHFYGHPEVSAEMAGKVLRRLRFPNATVDAVVELVAFHDVTLVATASCARRLLNKMSSPEQVKRLLKVRECDNRAHAEAAYSLFDTNTVEFAHCVDAVLTDQGAFKLKDLAVNGKDLIAAGMQPGPNMGIVLNVLLNAVLDGNVSNDKASLLALAKGMED